MELTCKIGASCFIAGALGAVGLLFFGHVFYASCCGAFSVAGLAVAFIAMIWN